MNTVTPTTAIAYFLTNGTVQDKYGDTLFHPLSNVNNIEIYIEDGDADNVVTINYNPEVRKKWATHWFPCFYRGLVEHTLDGESEPRTFAQYITHMPNILSSMNQNSETAMSVNATLRQQAGNNLIGSYATVASLPTSYGDWLDMQDLEENDVVAYVYESGLNGFYMVEYITSTYVWILQTSGITNYVSTKQYDVWELSVQAGFGNPAEITEISDEQYRLIWQELSSLSAYYSSNYELIQDLIDGTTPVGKAIADQNGNVIDTTYQLLSNLVTAFQTTPDDTHYASEKLIYDTMQNILDGTTPFTVMTLYNVNGNAVFTIDDEGVVRIAHGGVNHEVGENLFIRGDEVGTILNGDAVMYDGSIGASGKMNVVTITSANIATLIANTHYFLGVATQNFSGIQNRLNWYGGVSDLNTVAYTSNVTYPAGAGKTIYVDMVNGGLTYIRPAKPLPVIEVGIVVTYHASTGRILIRPNFSVALGELHDVDLNGGVVAGDIIIRNVGNTKFEAFNLTSALSDAVAVNDAKLLLKEDKANKGIAGGYAPLNSAGIVPSVNLPSYIDNIVDVPTYADLPVTGVSNRIYVVIADETSGGNTSTYRWASTVYVQISNTLSPAEVKALYEENPDTEVNLARNLKVTLFNQLLDNRNSLTEWELDGFSLIESNYIKLIEDNVTPTSYAYIDVTLPTDTQYTLLYKIYYVDGAGVLRLQPDNIFDYTNLEGSLGVYSELLTTKSTITVNELAFVVHGGVNGDYIGFRAVLFAGDLTGLTEAQQLDLIENTEYGWDSFTTDTIDAKIIYDEFESKVDKVTGSSLVTDVEIAHLIALDTQAELDAKLALKVDKVTGSSLIVDTELVDIKEDIVTLEHIVEMTYVSTGQFKATVNNFALSDGRKITVLFPNTLTDLTTAVQVSFDNGVTYKYLKYDDTLNVVTVKHSQNLKTEIYYDNTEWFMTGEALLPHTITHTQSIDSTKDTVAPVKGIPEFTEGLGLSINQEQENGNFDSGVISPFSATNIGTPTVSSGVVSFTATAISGRLKRTSDFIVGNTYYVSVKVKTTSSDVTALFFGVGSQYNTVAHSGGGNWEQLSYVGTITHTGVSFGVNDGRTSAWDEIQVTEFNVIDITNTPISAYTATQINGILNEYIEGITDNINLSIQSVGVQLVNVYDTEQGSLNTANGENASSSTRYRTINKIDVIGGEDYIFSGISSPFLTTSVFYYANDEFISYVVVNTGATSFTKTIPSNANQIRFTFGDGVTEQSLYEVQVEQGTVATAYVAYNSQTLSFKQLDLTDLHLRSVGSIRDKVRKEQEDWVKDEFVGVALAVAIGATINTTTIPLINTSGIFEAYDTVNNEYQYGAYGDTLTLTGTATVYYDYLTPLLANEILEATGSLIQEEVTTIIQGANIGTSVSIKYALNEGQSLLTVIANQIHIQNDLDQAQADIADIEELKWDDLRTPMTPAQISPNNSKPDFDYTNIGLLFPQNDTTEIVYGAFQMPHAYAEGTNIRPHIHCGQALDLQAVFKIDYKWVNIGDSLPSSWTTITLDQYAITYVSGTLHQLLYSSAEIDGTGMEISSILKTKLYRDDNVYTADMLVSDFDIHYQIDSKGSVEEYEK